MEYEYKNLENIAEWYKSSQLYIDKLTIKKRFDKYKNHFIGKNNCIELGPADGVMTEYLVKYFDNVTCVDGSKKLLNLIPDYKNLDKIHSLFEQMSVSKKFDNLVADHVLEHVMSPKEVLNNFIKLMEPTSRLFIGVPNADSFHRLLGVEMGMLESKFDLNERDITLGHRRVYNQKELINELENSGLRVISTGGVMFKPLSFSQLEKQFKPKQLEAFYKLGEYFPQNCSEIYAIATLN